jgi:dTDP-4-amino-4,6-dideoxyglucose
MKREVSELAFFGGPMTFAETVLVGRPNGGDRGALYARLDKALDSGRFTSGGPLVVEFEQRVADLVGTRHCIATCNGTVALEVMIRTAGLTGEIIMPSMTYVATAHAARYLGLTPVFADVDPVTGCIDPTHAEALITEQTTGIIGVHLWGQPAPVAQLEKLAGKYDLTLLFDAAHGIGCSNGDDPIGGAGTAEMISFHATKVVNAFEGGAIVTNDDEFARRARYMQNFGWGEDRITEFAGTNAKMTEASAAMGLTSLDALPASVAANRRNYELYSKQLAGLPGVAVHRYDEGNRNSYQYVVVRVDPDTSPITRDAVADLLTAENVLVRKYFSPGVHEMQPYVTERPVRLPYTDRLAGEVLSLPTGPSVTAGQIGEITGLIRFAVANAAEITDRIAA